MSKKPFFTGPFAPICESYVAQKRASGLDYNQQAKLLRLFDNFCKDYEIQSYTITKEIALTWCKKRPNEADATRYSRVSEMQRFAQYLCKQGGNVKKCAVGKHPKSEKHGNTAQFSEVERSGTQENCGGIESGCLLRLHPLPVPRRRQPKRVACIDPDAVVVDKNIAKNDRFDLFSR